jgi:hypothetical protein
MHIYIVLLFLDMKLLAYGFTGSKTHNLLKMGVINYEF